MKILNIMLSRDLGGIQQAFMDYSQALKSSGLQVINVISYGAKITSDSSFYKVVNLGVVDFISVMQLRKIIANECPDLIIAHGNRAMTFLSKIHNKNAPTIGVAHNYKVKWLKTCDYVFALTENLSDYLITQGIKKDRIKLVSNMIHLDSRPVRRALEREVPVIGTMGRFVKKKGFDIFLTALSLLKARGIKFKAIIGGGGEEEKSLKGLSDKLALSKHVSFIGWVEDKKQFFDAIDIFCLPSTHEPFGIILLEAMKYGVPIVSTASEGPSEIISDEYSGLLCSIFSASDMADKLEQMLAGGEKRNNMVNNAYLSLVQNYDIKVVGKILQHHLEQILHDISSNEAR